MPDGLETMYWKSRLTTRERFDASAAIAQGDATALADMAKAAGQFALDTLVLANTQAAGTALYEEAAARADARLSAAWEFVSSPIVSSEKAYQGLRDELTEIEQLRAQGRLAEANEKLGELGTQALVLSQGSSATVVGLTDKFVKKLDTIAVQKDLVNRQRDYAADGVKNPHFIDRHGAQTTLEQQYRRAENGTLPDNSPGKPTDASRFLDPKDMNTAINQAEALYARNPGAYPDGRVEIDMNRPVGEGYLGNTPKNKAAGSALEYRRTNIVEVGIDKTTGKSFTAFPSIKNGVKQPDPHDGWHR